MPPCARHTPASCADRSAPNRSFPLMSRLPVSATKGEGQAHASERVETAAHPDQVHIRWCVSMIVRAGRAGATPAQAASPAALRAPPCGVGRTEPRARAGSARVRAHPRRQCHATEAVRRPDTRVPRNL